MNKGTVWLEDKHRGTHKNFDYMLKNTSTKHNKYVVNQKSRSFKWGLFQRINILLESEYKDLSIPKTRYMKLR